MDREFYDPWHSEAEAIYFSRAAIHVHEEILRITQDQEAYNEIFFQVLT